MPDITMCEGEGCTIRDTCYRYTSKPCQYRQAYFTSSPCNTTGTACSYLKFRAVSEGVGEDDDRD